MTSEVGTDLRAVRCSPMTSEVGTDLRAVRPCSTWHFQRNHPTRGARWGMLHRNHSIGPVVLAPSFPARASLFVSYGRQERALAQPGPRSRLVLRKNSLCHYLPPYFIVPAKPCVVG